MMCRGSKQHRVACTLALWLVVISFFLCLPTEGRSIIVKPSLPLINAPFSVTVDFLQVGQNVFLSKSSACDFKLIVGTMCTLQESRTCKFTVSSESMGVSAQYDSTVPPLYVCSSGVSGKYIESLQLNVIDVTPRFVFSGKPFIVTFGAPTPVGSVVGFFSDDSCVTEINTMPAVTLGEDRTISLTLKKDGVLRLCCRIPHGNDDVLTSSYLPAAALYVLTPFSVSKDEALRYTTENFNLYPFTQIPYASFSRSPVCDGLLQDPIVGDTLQSITLPILVPKGKYYLCAGIQYYKQYRLYIPSTNQVTVHEYGIQPNVMYTGLSTTMILTFDGATLADTNTAHIALFGSSDCSKNPVISWSQTRTWVVSSPGTYYVCTRTGVVEGAAITTALAGNVTVLNAPTTSLSQSPAIQGLDVTVTLSNRLASLPGVITVGLSITSDCLTLASRGTTTETGDTATFRVPDDAFSTMYLCVSTPISTNKPLEGEEPRKNYIYSLKAITTRPYSLRYEPLFAGRAATINLDPDVKLETGTRGIFAKDGCKKTVGEEFSMDDSVLRNIVFPTAGTYSLCIKGPKEASSSSSSYSRVGAVVVYGPVKLTPSSIIAGATTEVTASLIPPNAPVKIISSGDCRSSTPLIEGNADGNGVVKLALLYTSIAELTVCVGYRGSASDGPWNVIPVAALPLTSVDVAPKAVIVSKTNRVNLLVPDPTSLTGFQAYAISGEKSSCTTATMTAAKLVLPVHIQENSHAFVLFTPNEAATWTLCVEDSNKDIFHLAQTIKSIDPLQITTNPKSAGAVGLSMQVTFSGPSWEILQPTIFFLTDKEESCTLSSDTPPLVYAKGNIDAADGVTDSFVTTEPGTMILCVGWKGSTTNKDNNDYFVYGNSIDMVTFTSISRYVIRETTNNILAFPLLEGGSLFLVSCTSSEGGKTNNICQTPLSTSICTRATKRYYTTSLMPLRDAPAGYYALCQEDGEKKGMSIANNLLSVVNPFVLTITDKEVRQYKNITFQISGGDMMTRSNAVKVFTMSPGLPCDSLALNDDGEGTTSMLEASEEAIIPAGVFDGSIKITKLKPFLKNVQLCIAPSPHDMFLGGQVNLLSYMTPSTMITNRPMDVYSHVWKENVVIKLTSNENCEGNVMKHDPVLIRNYVSQLFIDDCMYTNTELMNAYYCESIDGGKTYENRGIMSVIHLDDNNNNECGINKPSSILPVVVPPARSIQDYGIDTNVLTSPLLSTTSDCKNIVDYKNGFIPSFDERATFFVCVSTLQDPEYIFTTKFPTFQVEKFKISPTTLPSQLSDNAATVLPVQVQLNYPTGISQTYMSQNKDCADVIMDVSAFASDPSRIQISLKGISGLKYICIMSASNNKQQQQRVAIVEFLVVNPPNVSFSDPFLVRGAPYHVSLQVLASNGQPPLYSLVPGADEHNAFASFYVSSFRGIFLSNDFCGSIIKGTKEVYAWDLGHVTIPTAGISDGLTFLSLCVGTPAGNLVVIEKIKISTDIIFPSQFVLGTDTNVFVPLSPSSAFHLRQGKTCGGDNKEIVPSFATDAKGYGVLSLKKTSGEGLPPAGLWTLCVEKGTKTNFPLNSYEESKLSFLLPAVGGGVTLQALTSIEAFNPVYYNVRGMDIIVGVPSVLVLLGDLRVSSLLPGFSTNRECTDRSETYGKWSSFEKDNNSDNLKRIFINAVQPISSLYICATVPVNNSVVNVPQNDGLRFITPAFSIPSTVSRCNPSKLDSCALPISAPPGSYVAVIKGDCCNIADRVNIVGTRSRDSNNVCSLEMDPARVNGHSTDSTFSVCAWDTADDSYCTTLGHVKADNSECGESTSPLATISEGALIAIIVVCALCGVALILLLIYLAMRCCFGKSKTEERKETIFAYPQIYGREMNPLTLQCAPSGSRTQGREEQLCFGSQSSRHASASQQTISIGTSTEPTPLQGSSSDVSPGGMRFTLWDGIESDERDQIKLEEARDRYNLRLLFTEMTERIRLAEKEREMHFDLSDDWTHPFVAFRDCDNGADKKKNYDKDNDDVVAVRVASAPHVNESERLDEVERAERQNEIKVREMEWPASCWAVAFSPPPKLQSCDEVPAHESFNSMSYTTTQRFHDEWRLVVEGEAVRRQRIYNLAEEEWEAIVSAEFNSFVRNQRSTSQEQPPSPPPPHLPQSILLPFAVLPEQQKGTGNDVKGNNNNNNNNNNNEEEDGDEDVYEAPSCPARLLKYGVNEDVRASRGSNEKQMPAPPLNRRRHVMPEDDDNNIYDDDMPSGGTMFSESMPSAGKVELRPHTPENRTHSHYDRSNSKNNRNKSSSPRRYSDPISDITPQIDNNNNNNDSILNSNSLTKKDANPVEVTRH